MDRIDPERRSANMSRIRSADTKVELLLRHQLWSSGIRGYRVHPKGLPGKPDIAFTRWKLAVFVDGCFWHACPRCFVAPSSNTAYWNQKIQRNVERDEQVSVAMRELGWQLLRIWEHEIEGDLEEVVRRISAALEAAGRPTG